MESLAQFITNIAERKEKLFYQKIKQQEKEITFWLTQALVALATGEIILRE